MANDEIYTIGHSRLDIGAFVRLLLDHGVQCVADVRSVPSSRFVPQYNRQRLSEVLMENDIRYLYMGDRLGGRIRDPECFLDRRVPDRNRFMDMIDYGAVVSKEWFSGAIDELIGISRGTRTALLCSEEDPEKCHRKMLVGRRLEEKGIRVVHIRSKIA